MRILVKYVKKASQWCVTTFEVTKDKKGHKQKQYWFSSEEEARSKEGELNE